MTADEILASTRYVSPTGGHDDVCIFYRSEIEVIVTKLAASSAREKVLHEALRDAKIMPFRGFSGFTSRDAIALKMCCTICKATWSAASPDVRGPEAHATDCIARPDYLTAQDPKP